MNAQTAPETIAKPPDRGAAGLRADGEDTLLACVARRPPALDGYPITRG